MYSEHLMKHPFVLRRRRRRCPRETVNQKILAKYPPLVLVAKPRQRKQELEPEPREEEEEEKEDLTQPQLVNMPYNL